MKKISPYSGSGSGWWKDKTQNQLAQLTGDRKAHEAMKWFKQPAYKGTSTQKGV